MSRCGGFRRIVLQVVPVVTLAAFLGATGCTGDRPPKSPHPGGEMPPLKGRKEVTASRSEATVGMARFRGTSAAFRELPDSSRAADLELALEITNLGDHPVQFRLLNALQFRLLAPGGTTVRYQSARDATPREGHFSPSIAPGQSFVITRSARLERQSDGSLRLSGIDGFGGLWWFEGLHPGTYTFEFEFDNDDDDDVKSDDKSPHWRGHARIPAITLAIR
jgi:hypothetical protein